MKALFELLVNDFGPVFVRIVPAHGTQFSLSSSGFFFTGIFRRWKLPLFLPSVNDWPTPICRFDDLIDVVVDDTPHSRLLLLNVRCAASRLCNVFK